MSYELTQTVDLELTNKDNETIIVDNFQQVNNERVSKQSHKEDDETWQTTFEASVEGQTVTALVTYTSGLSGLDVQEVEISGIPKNYEETTSANFEFQECEDDF